MLGFREYLRVDLESVLHEQGIRSGRICELGGPHNSFAKNMPDFEFTFLSLYPDKGFDNILGADATNCDHLEGEQFDAIYSTSVFEHIGKHWLAAENLSRLLKPGGVMYHAAPFSYFYHGAPADFWRFTPDALTLIFSDLKPIKAEFFGRNRRRDNRGSELNAVDRDGGPQFAVDGFGGWRENWFTIFAGLKDPDYSDGVLETAKQQVVVNLMKQLELAGVAGADAADQVVATLRRTRITRDQEVSLCDESESSFAYTVDDVLGIWRTRGRRAPRPGYNRFVMARRLGLE